MWEIDNLNQIYTFFIFLTCGIALKLFYDIMRAKRKIKKSGNLRVLFFDVLFWSVSAVITFLLLIARTNGDVRGYALFAELCGFILCHFTLSKIWMKILGVLFKMFYRIFGAVSAGLCSFAIILTRFGDVFLKICGKCIKKALKSAKKLLKNIKRMLYTEKNQNNLNGEETDG